jgi:hypothetical protein
MSCFSRNWDQEQGRNPSMHDKCRLASIAHGIEPALCFVYISLERRHICSDPPSFEPYVCRLKMVLGPKHVEAVTTEGEKKNCCVDGTIIT